MCLNTNCNQTLVLATPHHRYDFLEKRIREFLPDFNLLRFHSREEMVLENLQKINPLYIFFPHWSWIIPEDIFGQFECVVFHMTDLPYGRGGSPLQNLIVRGHKETQLSALKCISELDAGPIYLKNPLSLSGTAEEILHRSSILMEEMIVNIVRKRLVPLEQEGEIITFKRRRPEDGDITPLSTLEQVYNHVRMLDGEGYPKAFIETEYFYLEFSQVEKKDGTLNAKVVITEKLL